MSKQAYSKCGKNLQQFWTDFIMKNQKLGTNITAAMTPGCVWTLIGSVDPLWLLVAYWDDAGQSTMALDLDIPDTSVTTMTVDEWDGGPGKFILARNDPQPPPDHGASHERGAVEPGAD